MAHADGDGLRVRAMLHGANLASTARGSANFAARILRMPGGGITNSVYLTPPATLIGGAAVHGVR